MIIDSYKTITSENETAFKISNSRFIAGAFPVEELSDVNKILEGTRKKYFDASHHPYAFVLGLNPKQLERFSDDGEPSGSSGKPVLEAVKKFDLTNVLVVVTRYFGGTKLGIGGLRRAYLESAEKCLSEVEIVTKFITQRVQIFFDYAYLSKVMNTLKQFDAKIIHDGSNIEVILTLESRLSKSEQLIESLTEVTNGSIKLIKV